MVTIRGLKPLEGRLSLQNVPLNKTLMLQGNVYLMVMAGQILTSLLVEQVSNDLITSKIIMTITVLHAVLLYEFKNINFYLPLLLCLLI